MQPSFLFKRLLQQRLTIVIRYYMVYLQNVIKQLQRVQNVAACVVTLSPKFCHITPVLGNPLAVRAFNITVMAVVLFLLLPRFFGLVFLSILGMLDHWTFLKDS